VSTDSRPAVSQPLAVARAAESQPVTGATIGTAVGPAAYRTAVRRTLTGTAGATIRTAVSTTIGTAGCRATVGQTFVAGRGCHVVVVQTHDAAPFESASVNSPVRKVARG
jgi:hypothetical protein